MRCPGSPTGRGRPPAFCSSQRLGDLLPTSLPGQLGNLRGHASRAVPHGAAFFGGGSSPDALLPGLQAKGQACGAYRAAPADRFRGADLVQRRPLRRDGEEELGIFTLAGPQRHPAGGRRNLPRVSVIPRPVAFSHHRFRTRKKSGPQHNRRSFTVAAAWVRSSGLNGTLPGLRRIGIPRPVTGPCVTGDRWYIGKHGLDVPEPGRGVTHRELAAELHQAGRVGRRERPGPDHARLARCAPGSRRSPRSSGAPWFWTSAERSS